MFERVEEYGLGLRRACTKPEPSREGLDEVLAGQNRIVQANPSDVAARFGLERRMEKRRLAGAGLAQQHRQRLGRADAVVQVAERLPVSRRQEQELRVRRQLERQVAKTVKLLIHRAALSVQPPE